MIKAWALVKLASVDTKAAGVTHGKRQKALEHLTSRPAEAVSVTLERDAANVHDKNAAAVVVAVAGKGSYTVNAVPNPKSKSQKSSKRKGKTTMGNVTNAERGSSALHRNEKEIPPIRHTIDVKGRVFDIDSVCTVEQLTVFDLPDALKRAAVKRGAKGIAAERKMLLRDAKEKGAIGQKNIQIWVWMH